MLKAFANKIMKREPDYIIGGVEDPYLIRWWVIPRNAFFNIYLHRIIRSDDDRALHDHPWFNLSILVDGMYIEETIRKGGIHDRTLRKAGDFKFRTPWAAHRLEVVDGQECITLFITGPRLRHWGFHCPRGWRHWKMFTSGPNGETIGRGCE